MMFAAEICALQCHLLKVSSLMVYIALGDLVLCWIILRRDWAAKAKFINKRDKQLGDSNLEKNLNDYLNIDKPDFAVMITSRWGLGKTFFIKQYIAKKSSLFAKNKPIYVSLYGMHSENQLEQELIKRALPSFNAICLIFSGITVAVILNFFVYLIGNFVFKDSQKLDLIQFWLPIFWAGCFFCYKLFRLKLLEIILRNRSIVFDDFERILIPPEEMLAYINRYVEHLHKHVIVICNEEKMQNGEGKSDKGKYDIVKEKVFGKTFTIEQDQKEIIRSLITEKGTPLLYEFLYTRQSFDWFYKRCKVKDCQLNLRVFQRTLQEFERFFRHADKVRLFNSRIINHLIPDFFCFFYMLECPELPNGHTLSKNQVREATIPLEGSETKDLLRRYFSYSFLSYPLSVLPPDCWDALLRHKDFPTREIDEYWKYLINGDQRLFARFFALRFMSDIEINEIMQELKTQMRSKALNNPYEILCILGNLLYFFDTKSDKIRRQTYVYISILEKANAFPEEFITPAKFSMYKSDSGNRYENYDIPNAKSEVMVDVRKYLTGKLQSFYTRNQVRFFEEYLQQLASYDADKCFKWWLEHQKTDFFSNIQKRDVQRLFDLLLNLREKDFSSEVSRLLKHLGESHIECFNDFSFWDDFNQIAQKQMEQWIIEEKMFSKVCSLKELCGAVEKYIEDKKDKKLLA